jgi:hypothetical protein
VTSIAALTGRAPSVREVATVALSMLADVFDRAVPAMIDMSEGELRIEELAGAAS